MEANVIQEDTIKDKIIGKVDLPFNRYEPVPKANTIEGKKVKQSQPTIEDDSFISEVPVDLIMQIPSGIELRCGHFNEKKGDICNKLLCRGQASLDPQEFKCPNCGKKTIFKRIG
jgi:hypothetical protein